MPLETPRDWGAAHETCRHKAYALTCEWYEQLLARADGRCEICRRAGGTTPRTKLHIDHDFLIGMWAVRGLLCVDCNIRLIHPDSAAAVPGYLSQSWYLSLLANHDLAFGNYAEPPLRAEVWNRDGWYWRHYAAGWIRQDTAHHRARHPLTWERLLYRFGPINLQVVERPSRRRIGASR